MRSLLLGVLVVAACGGDGSSPGSDAAPPDTAPWDSPIGVDAPTGFALTSPTVTEGQPIPVDHTCNGANTSPQLAWTGAPGGALSYAVVLTDKSNNLVHSVIYDIPGTATGLPADVDKVYAPPDVAGAHQTPSYDTSVRGYNGPCPGTLHTYELKLYAVTVATLPGASMSTTRAQAVTLLDANNAGTTTLTGTYAPL